MTALTVLTSGSITINGCEVSRNTTSFKVQIGLVPQHINLEPELSVRDNLKLHGMLYKMSPLVIEDRIKELLEFTDLNDKARKQVKTLSGGMKRKILIARALMHNPSVLILDEPTVGLDVFSRRVVWDLMKSLHKRGKTIILTTHYLEEAENLCTRIALLKSGKLLMCDSFDGMQKKVGSVVVERFVNDQTLLEFYQDRNIALEAAKELKGESFNIRKAKLEDIFVKLTEKKEWEK